MKKEEEHKKIKGTVCANCEYGIYPILSSQSC